VRRLSLSLSTCLSNLSVNSSRCAINWYSAVSGKYADFFQKIQRTFGEARLWCRLFKLTPSLAFVKLNNPLAVQPKPIDGRTGKKRGFYCGILEEILEDIFQTIKASTIKFLAKGIKIYITVNLWSFDFIYTLHCCYHSFLYIDLKSL
jgi:hypothetical protein